ncbi:MAG: phosphoglycerate mutase family protein [Chloroflexi bacterium]|nr:phosphoglycerate mutase family protein [Chloroflexota bacterium]
MRKLILVKHAQPTIDPGVPASQWQLSDAGREACAPLARRLAAHQPAAVVSSSEPKAFQTAVLVAQSLGLAFHAAEGLHEHDRSNVAFQSQHEFEAAVAAFFDRPNELVFGRETAAQAQARFTRGVEAVLRLHPQGNIALVAHGTVMTLFVTSRVAAERTRIAPFSLWQRLGLPSYVVLSLPDYTLIEIVEHM